MCWLQTGPYKTKGWEKDKQSNLLRKNTKKINGQVFIVIHSNSDSTDSVICFAKKANIALN